MTDSGGKLVSIYSVQLKGHGLTETELRAHHLATFRNPQNPFHVEEDFVAINDRYYVNVVRKLRGDGEMGVHVVNYSDAQGQVYLPPTYFFTNILLRLESPLVCLCLLVRCQ